MDVQQTILAYIKENGPIKALELSRKTNIPESTVFKHLKHLINQDRLFVDSESKYYYKSAPATPPPEPKPQFPPKETENPTSNVQAQEPPKTTQAPVKPPVEDKAQQDSTAASGKIDMQELNQRTNDIINTAFKWEASVWVMHIKNMAVTLWGLINFFSQTKLGKKILRPWLIDLIILGIIIIPSYFLINHFIFKHQAKESNLQEPRVIQIQDPALIDQNKQLQDHYQSIQQELEKTQAEKQKIVDQNDRLSQEKEEASRGLIDQARTIKEEQQKINQLKEQVKELETSLKMANAAPKVSMGNAVNIVKDFFNPQATHVPDISIQFDENGERTK